MAVFNWLEVKEECPTCNKVIAREIQFKYGEVWMHKYKLGDVLIWDKNKLANVGDPKDAEVQVLGIAVNCPLCDAKSPFEFFSLEIRKGQITRVEPIDEDFEFPDTGYLVGMP